MKTNDSELFNEFLERWGIFPLEELELKEGYLESVRRVSNRYFKSMRKINLSKDIMWSPPTIRQLGHYSKGKVISCSCPGCVNSRKYYGKTLDEIRADDDLLSQLENSNVRVSKLSKVNRRMNNRTW